MEFVKKITHASLWQVFYLCTYFVSQKYWLEAVGSFLPTAVKRSRMCWLGSENLGAASFALIFLNLLLCSILNCWKTAKHWLQPASLAASIPTKPPAFKPVARVCWVRELWGGAADIVLIFLNFVLCWRSTQCALVAALRLAASHQIEARRINLGRVGLGPQTGRLIQF